MFSVPHCVLLGSLGLYTVADGVIHFIRNREATVYFVDIKQSTKFNGKCDSLTKFDGKVDLIM